jgi:maspardin
MRKAMSLAKLVEFQARFPEQVVSAGGGDWLVRETRGGPTNLFLLPGAQGTADLFYKTALVLGDRINCVTVTPPAWADIDRIADSLSALLDTLELASAPLLGSSLSGYLLQVFALKYPERVETLFLANTFYDASPIQAALPTPEALAGMTAEAVVNEVLIKLVPQNARDSVDAELKAVLGALVGTKQSAETLKTRLLALVLAKPVARVPLPDERLVLIDDDADPVIPLPVRKQLRDRYRNAEHHAISGGGHYPMVLRPDAYAEIIGRRLRRASVNATKARRFNAA